MTGLRPGRLRLGLGLRRRFGGLGLLVHHDSVAIEKVEAGSGPATVSRPGGPLRKARCWRSCQGAYRPTPHRPIRRCFRLRVAGLSGNRQRQNILVGGCRASVRRGPSDWASRNEAKFSFALPVSLSLGSNSSWLPIGPRRRFKPIRRRPLPRQVPRTDRPAWLVIASVPSRRPSVPSVYPVKTCRLTRCCG